MIKFLEFCHDFSSECSHNQLCVVVFVVYNDVTYCVSEVHNLLEKDALFIVLVYTTTVDCKSINMRLTCRLSALISEVLQFQRLKINGTIDSQAVHGQVLPCCFIRNKADMKSIQSD